MAIFTTIKIANNSFKINNISLCELDSGSVEVSGSIPLGPPVPRFCRLGDTNHTQTKIKQVSLKHTYLDISGSCGDRTVV
jgi:hypothetical protein